MKHIINIIKLPQNYKVLWSNQWEPATKTQHAAEVYIDKFGKDKVDLFCIGKKARDYLKEVKTTDNYQIKKNKEALKDIKKTIIFCNKINSSIKKYDWIKILDFAHKNLSFDAQEIIKVQMIEIYLSLIHI